MIYGRNKIISLLDAAAEKNKAGKDYIDITTPDNDFDRESQVGRDSIDLRIDTKAYRIKQNVEFVNTLDTDVENCFEEVTIEKDGYRLRSGETIIVSTVEKIKLAGNMMGMITGRTRFARMGLSVCAATKFQSYSDAVVVLQITNNNLKVPLKIFPHQKLAQLIIYEVTGVPLEGRGRFRDESTLKKPEIDAEELKHFTEEEKKAIQRQKPNWDQYINDEGNLDIEKKIKRNNDAMNMISKIANSISALLGLLIGIICSFYFNITLIVSLAIASFFCTIFAVAFDVIRDNNQIKKK